MVRYGYEFLQVIALPVAGVRVGMDKTPGKESTPWGEGRIVFLAHKADIQARINEGWPLSKIYKEYQSKLGGLSYPGFTRSVRQYLEVATEKKKNGPEKKPVYAAQIREAMPSASQSSHSGPQPFFQKGDRAPSAENLI